MNFPLIDITIQQQSGVDIHYPFSGKSYSLKEKDRHSAILVTAIWTLKVNRVPGYSKLNLQVRCNLNSEYFADGTG